MGLERAYVCKAGDELYAAPHTKNLAIDNLCDSALLFVSGKQLTGLQRAILIAPPMHCSRTFASRIRPYLETNYLDRGKMCAIGLAR
jgi:hypothetical protein